MTDTRPKLLFFSHFCSSVLVTGAEKALLLFARELTVHYQCVLVVPQEGAIANQARAFGIGVLVQEIPLCVSVFGAPASVQLDVYRLLNGPQWTGLLDLLARENPACVWTNTTVHPLPALAAKCLGIPVVWGVMETLTDTPHRSLSAELIAANSDVVVGISDTVLAPLREQAGHKSVWVPPHLVPDDLQAPMWPENRALFRAGLGLAETHRVTGFIASHLYPAKGLEPFVRAMLHVGALDPNARFLVVGYPIDPVLFEHCKQLTVQAGMADRFSWVPYVENVQHVFPAMDVVVVPSLIPEGFGMTALEGMFFARPVVAFASGGLAEILTSTGNAEFLAPTGDVATLALNVLRLLLDETLRAQVGWRNAQEAERVFGLQASRARLAGLAARIPPPRPFPPSFFIRGSKPYVYLLQNGVKRLYASVRSLPKRGVDPAVVVPIHDSLFHAIPTDLPVFGVGRRRGRRRTGRRPARGRMRRARLRRGSGGRLRRSATKSPASRLGRTGLRRRNSLNRMRHKSVLRIVNRKRRARR